MNDLKALDEAFAELERRADNAPHRPEPARARGPRLVPVAAALLVAAGLVIAVAVLAPGTGSGAPVQEGAGPSSTARLPVEPTGPPASSEELAGRFSTVLGGGATFTVTANGGSDATYITGVLTVSGLSGGYDIQVYKQKPGNPGARCEDLDRVDCHIKILPDGSSLATGSETLRNNPQGTTIQVHLVRKDGTTIIMHVSNERDPKGESDILAPQPPLTIAKVVEIVTSPQW